MRLPSLGGAMRRRDFLAAIAGTAVGWPRVAFAEQLAMPVVGVLSPFSEVTSRPWHGAFLRGLRDLGWIVGKNIAVEYRYADGKGDRVPDLIADLVRLRVNVILTAVTNDSLAAKNATGSIPIVMAAPGDPVATGIVASLGHPGGNVTGLSQMTPDITGKRLEFLKELAPELSVIAVLFNPDDPISVFGVSELDQASRRLSVALRSFGVRTNADLDRALDAVATSGANGLAILPHPIFVTNLKRLADFALQRRLPSMFHLSEFVVLGGLLSYGVDRSDLYRRAASYVDKILKGANAGELPIEQPTKFDLAINVKTAGALGLKVPQALIATADEVIE